MLTPAFHYGVLQQFVDIFIEHGNNLVEYLKSQGDDTIQDVVSLGTKHALNAICGKNHFNLIVEQLNIISKLQIII